MVVKTNTKETVSIPKNIFESMLKAYKSIEQLQVEMEDFLLAHNEEFIKKMRKARKNHLRGNVRDIDELKL